MSTRVLRSAAIVLAIFSHQIVYAQDVKPDSEGQTSKIRENRAMRDQLWGQVERLAANDETSDAMSVAQELINLERRLHPDTPAERKRTLNWAIIHCIETNDLVRALELADEWYACCADHLGADHWETSSARFLRQYIRTLTALSSEKRRELRELEAEADELAESDDPKLTKKRFRQLAEVEVEALGAQSPYYANTLYFIGTLSRDSQDWGDAVKMFEKAFRIRLQAFGPNHPSTVSARAQFGHSLAKSGKLKEGLSQLEQAIDSHRAAKVDEETSINAFFQFAGMYESLKQYEQARPLYEHVLDRLARSVGMNHPTYLVVLDDLTVVCYRTRDLEAAEQYGSKALELKKKAYGEKHASFVRSLRDLARVYVSARKFDEAKKAYEKALKLIEELVGSEHEAYAATLISCADVCRKNLRDYDRAKQLSARAVEIRKKLYGEQHPLYIEALEDLVSVDGEALKKERDRLVNATDQALKQGDRPAALKFATRRLELEKSAYSFTNPQIAEATRWLIEFQKSDGAPEVVRELKEDLAKQLRWDWVDLVRDNQHDRALAIAHQESELRTELDDEPGLADALIRIGSTHKSEGDFRKAESFFKRGLSIRKKSSESNPRPYADVLWQLGNLYRSTNELEKAEQTFRLAQKAVSKNPKDYLHSLSMLGHLYLDWGKRRQAKELFAEALTVTDAMDVQTDGWNIASALGNLAKACEDLGDAADAIPLLERCCKIQKNLPSGQFSYSISLLRLGALRASIGQYDRAIKMLEESNAIIVKRFGERGLENGLSLVSIAQVYLANGDVIRAKEIYQQGYALIRGAGATPDVSVLTGMARVALLSGDYVQCAELCDEATQFLAKSIENAKIIRSQGETDESGVLSLPRLTKQQCGVFAIRGTLAMVTDGPDQGEVLFRKRHEMLADVLGESHPDLASAENDLLLVHIARNQFSVPRDPSRAIDISADHWKRTALILSEQQELLLSQNLRSYLDVFLTLLQHQRDDQLAFRKTLEWKGRAFRRHRFARLAAESQDIADLFDELQSVTRQWARLAARDVSSLQPELVSRRDDLESRKEQLEIELGRQSVAYRKSANPVSPDELIGCLESDTAIIDFLVYADYEWIGLEQRAGIGAGLQSTERGIQIASLVPGGAANLDGTLKIGDIVVAVEEPGKGWQDLEGLEQSETVNRIVGSVDSQIKLRVTRKGRAEPLEVTLKRKRLPFQQSGKFQITPTLLAFVVRSDGHIEMFNLGPVAPIDDAIESWRSTLGMSRESKQAGRFLYEHVWQPLMPSLNGAKKILISPDGSLGRMPFAALPGAASESYLLEDHRITMVPIPSLIPELLSDDQPPQTKRDLLLVGDVDYDVNSAVPLTTSERRRKPWERSTNERLKLIQRQTNWEPLKETRLEVAELRDTWARLHDAAPESIAELRGRAATEAAFRGLSPDCKFLHIATHGFFAAAENSSALSPRVAAARGSLFGSARNQVGVDPGLLAGLVFAGANNPPELTREVLSQSEIPDDGILTANEIAALPLSRVQLAVLSACETGLGEVAAGEGLLGIQRAFQVSGVDSVVATMWKVDDKMTRMLMERFYRNLFEKRLSKLDALRDAQLWLLKNPSLVEQSTVDRGRVRKKKDSVVAGENSEGRTNPYYWAPFVLSGDWR